MVATLSYGAEDFDVRACYLAPYTRSTNVYGTAVQVLFQGGDITETVRSADRPGDGSLYATYTKLDFTEINLSMSAHEGSVYSVLTGGSYRTSGSGSSEVRTFGTPVNKIFPYFGLKMLADLADGGVVVLFAPVCTVSGNISWSISDNSIIMPSVNIRAYRNSNYVDNLSRPVPIFKIEYASATSVTEDAFPDPYFDTSGGAWSDV